MKPLYFGALIGLVIVANGCTKDQTSTQTPNATLIASQKPAELDSKLSGTISISPKLSNKVGAREILFVIIRNERTGPPVAVRKISNPRFPLKYEIGLEDSMLGDNGAALAHSQSLSITARIAKSGTAMPRKGDLEGAYAKTDAKLGDQHVDILIDKIR